MAPSFPFRSALVTGASSGIGAEMVRQLARAGVPTVVVARRADRLEALAAELHNIEVLAADLGEPDGVATVADRIAADGGRSIDLVVNNAGFGTSGSFVDLDADRLAAEIDLNVGALTRLSHAALSVMATRRRGWLLNVSSVASFQPAPHLAVYAATKAYVTSFSESLHGEMGSSGVVVSALCPGLTRTEFQSVSNTRGLSDLVPRVRVDRGRGRRSRRTQRCCQGSRGHRPRVALQGPRRGERRDPPLAQTRPQRHHPTRGVNRWCLAPPVQR